LCNQNTQLKECTSLREVDSTICGWLFKHVGNFAIGCSQLVNSSVMPDKMNSPIC
jgi:hypothetical protein